MEKIKIWKIGKHTTVKMELHDFTWKRLAEFIALIVVIALIVGWCL
ncbi:hypothetical protein M3M38_00065 [Fructilactobacillus cliffordii]|nr:hypothetical protein [Fructilactobacillus cliffordii]USS86511.1 hypothetical protein M3M38_00065 [Fructilactobacillus cliffordii]